jgi:hypothetical protein
VGTSFVAADALTPRPSFQTPPPRLPPQVEFDEKSPRELLAILNDVLGEIDRAQRVRLAGWAPGTTSYAPPGRRSFRAPQPHADLAGM